MSNREHLDLDEGGDNPAGGERRGESGIDGASVDVFVGCLNAADPSPELVLLG